MAIRKPDFITKQIRGGRPTVTRPYKWAPGIPSLAIQFEEIPGESKPRAEEPLLEDVLGDQNAFAILTADDRMIGVTLP